jgi:branched-chain amino acid transport system permease protein
MTQFLQQVVAGAGNGSIYAIMALALVLIYRSTHIVNFGQGEMAMFSTYLAWSLINADVAYWLAFLVTIAISFVGGVVIERVLIRPVEHSPELSIVIVTLGLLLFFNSIVTWRYTGLTKTFPFPAGVRRDSWDIGGVFVKPHDVTVIVVLLGIMVALFLFFQFTKLGLAMRAAAAQPASSRLVGIRVGMMLALGWGMAAAIGAIAGMLIAPVVVLEPNFMAGVLIYSFAGATLGGFDSPVGAVVGGFAVGEITVLGGRYIDFVGNELQIVLALVVILAVLVIRPSGLFGRPQLSRV